MIEFREELIQAITVVATTTGMTVGECIDEALKIFKKEQKKYRNQQRIREFSDMFRGW